MPCTREGEFTVQVGSWWRCGVISKPASSPTAPCFIRASDRRAVPPADVIKDRRVTALIQGLAPALSDGSRLSWAAPSSLHEGLGFRAMAPDRIQGDAAKPRFDEAQSGIMFAQTRRRPLRPKRLSLAPRSPPSSPLRAASGGDLRSGLTAPARGAADSPRSGRRNALRSNKETGARQSPANPIPLTRSLIQG